MALVAILVRKRLRGSWFARVGEDVVAPVSRQAIRSFAVLNRDLDLPLFSWIKPGGKDVLQFSFLRTVDIHDQYSFVGESPRGEVVLVRFRVHVNIMEIADFLMPPFLAR